MAILTTDQKQIINKCVDKMILSENKEEMLNYFLRCFCFNTENCNLLLRSIPQIAERMNTINNQRILDYSNALDMAYNYTAMSKEYPDGYIAQKFSMMVSMFKVKFPNGDVSKASKFTQNLFEEMVSYIRDGSGFKMDNEQSWEWADTIDAGDFLVNVIRNNIDENFECPYIG